jgi:hypothetical protein
MALSITPVGGLTAIIEGFARGEVAERLKAAVC